MSGEIPMIDGLTGETVRTFDTVDDMFDWMRRTERTALAGCTEAQLAVTYGDFFMRPVEVDGEVLMIFGRVPSWEEFERAESEDPDEWKFIRSDRLESDARGYRFSWCFSLLVPDGEPGDTHVSVMYPISQEAFEQAKAREWDFVRCLADGLPWAVAVAGD